MAKVGFAGKEARKGARRGVLLLCLCLRTVAVSCAIDGYYGEGRRDFYFF